MNKDTKEFRKPSSNTQGAEKLGDKMNSSLYEKNAILVEVANNTFKELCLTLEAEQAKLLELEQRRKKLQEEMQLLKIQIEDEKRAYHLNLSDGNADSSMDLNTSSSSLVIGDQTDEESGTDSIRDFIERQHAEVQQMCCSSMQLLPLETCFEVDENNEDIEPEDDNQIEVNQMDSDANNIHKELQGVVAECIIEQCKVDDPSNAVDDILPEPETSDQPHTF